ncbi:MAG: sulfotransferase [Gammaproteobacteria bacterium]|nr:sulfotransferase [Gammaproteobacteria bacterium]MDP6616118.1 sulfotransferase [Gammaproteobacteria bacterium]MDP6694864.1 sulfotransferase [Gammaproteobacteria bacterium]MDP7041202.1 sulfotransferase [Gammaproteobacteria bacterium]
MPEVSEHTAEHRLQDAARLIHAGRLDDAEKICLAALKTNVMDEDAIYWSAIIALERRQFSDAARLLQYAIRENSNRPEFHAQLGRCFVALKRSQDALAAADAAMALHPANPMTLDTIGVIYSYARFHEQAAQAFKQAVAGDPDNDSYWYNLGASQQFAGHFDAAEDAYQRAIEINGSLDKAIAALSHMRPQTPDSNHIATLCERLDGYEGSLRDEMRLKFALAKEYDDTGHYNEAFATISEVSRRWRSKIEYSIEQDARLFDSLHECFTPAAVSRAGAGHDSTEPVFVVGMPRTGTTLTERIISSHSAIYSAGELNSIGLLVSAAANLRVGSVLTPEAVDQALGSNLKTLGERYIELTRPATGRTPHFVDKMPLNFLCAGFILLALPNARFICVRRNPMDSCLSNFRQLFALSNRYYAFSYDILDCGRYYLMFDRLMRHWDELFPGRILQINYEDIVEEQEKSSRDLIAFCGLDWEDQCMDFDKNEAPVATASSAQVRQPLYRTALERWKNYEEQLEPLAALLREGGIRIP